MSTFNIKSTFITQRDATGIKAQVDTIQSAGLVKEMIGVERTGAAIIDAASTIRLVSVPSRARVSALEYFAQSLGTSALDIAVWYPTNIPQGGLNAPAASLEGTLIGSSVFAQNIAGVDTGIAPTDGLGTIAQNSIPKRSQPLWQAAGLSSDPGIDLDLGFVVRTATSVQGYVGLRVRYID